MKNKKELLLEQDLVIKKNAISNNFAFDVNKECYCNVCERNYKNYKRYCIHMKSKHYY